MPKSRRRSTRDWLNRLLTSGSVGGILILGVAVSIVIAFGAGVASLFHIHAGENDLSFADALWEVTQRAIDPGQLDGELEWSSRILLLAITGIGILLISTLISIVNSTLERRIERLRRGRGPVEASDHLVILGWSETGVKVAEELAEAFVDVGALEVVVLADHDPIEIANAIAEDVNRRHPEWRRRRHVRRPESWLTVRRGDVTSIGDLANLARLATARSVVVLGDSRSDAEITKVILAIVASIQTPDIERTSPLNIVAAISDNDLGRKLQRRIHLLSAEAERNGEPIAELIPVIPAFMRTGIEAQVVRHRGLSEIYRDLLDFDGDELHRVSPPPGATTFGELALADGVVAIGLMEPGSVELWPSWDEPVAGRQVVVLAPSLDVARRSLSTRRGPVLSGQRPRGRSIGSTPDSILVIGWNRFAGDLLRLLIATSPPASTVTVLVHRQDHLDTALVDGYPQVSVVERVASTDPLDERLFIEQFDHVIVLSHEELPPAESDATVLADVLACRITVNGSELRRSQPTTVVAELRQRVSKNIAGVRLADDLLLSESLSASAMAHLAVNPEMAPVLTAILSADSPDHVQLMSIEGESAAFIGVPWHSVRRTLAEQQGELAIALRTRGSNGVVVVNPQPQRLVGEGDEIIVFSRYALDPIDSTVGLA
ncbi:MAG: hypothetical protein EBU70_03385 [Actinobacteria bacterium]|nr:hypothetical protein [Actinomycetota bacterium]